MRPIVVEIYARIVDGAAQPEPLGRVQLAEPRTAAVQVARLLRRIADQMDAETEREPSRLGDLLPDVTDMLAELSARQRVTDRHTTNEENER